VDWVEARVLLAQNKWFAASRQLRTLRGKFGDAGGLSDQIDVQLGLCYERLGQYDPALQAYEGVLQHNPKNEPAEIGKQRMLAMTDRPATGSGEIKDKDKDLDQRIAEEMAKPKADRNWKEIDAALDKLVKDRKLEGSNLDLFWARIMLQREDFASARKY